MMIRFLILFFLSVITSASFAAVPQSLNQRLDETPDYLRVENFLRLNVTEFESITGSRLNMIQKTHFKRLQRKLAKSNFTSDSTILNYYNPETGKFKLDPLWFILGCIIGPFAVLFSHTTHKQTKNKKRSALLGFVVFVVWFGWLYLF